MRWDLDDLVAASDIADLAGVSRGTVSNWQRRRVDFPAPLVVRGGYGMWSRTQVMAWLTGRQPIRGLKVGEVDVLAMVGQRLSERVAAVWPYLSTAEQELYCAVDTEDEFRALLNEHEKRLPS
jgi:hypothetical protein